MKARKIKGSSNKSKKMRMRLTRTIDQMSVVDIIKNVPRWVEGDFYTTVEAYKDDENINSADILIEMMNDRYLKEFPKSAWKAVKTKIASMMNKRLLIALEDVVDVECKKRNISKEEVINQIKSSDDFIGCIFPESDIPEFYRSKMQETINNYVKDMEEKLNPDAEKMAEEVISTEEESPAEEVISTEKEKSVEEENVEMSEEDKFIEAVGLFTNNYAFLAEDVKSYYASKGNRSNDGVKRRAIDRKTTITYKQKKSEKFKSVDDAIKFITIQTIIRRMMPDGISNEEGAIRNIISSLSKDTEARNFVQR